MPVQAAGDHTEAAFELVHATPQPNNTCPEPIHISGAAVSEKLPAAAGQSTKGPPGVWSCPEAGQAVPMYVLLGRERSPWPCVGPR